MSLAEPAEEAPRFCCCSRFMFEFLCLPLVSPQPHPNCYSLHHYCTCFYYFHQLGGSEILFSFLFNVCIFFTFHLLVLSFISFVTLFTIIIIIDVFYVFLCYCYWSETTKCNNVKCVMGSGGREGERERGRERGRILEVTR